MKLIPEIIKKSKNGIQNKPFPLIPVYYNVLGLKKRCNNK